MTFVLCLDDDESVARLVADMAEFCKQRAVVETNSLEAITKHVQNEDLKAVLADYMMPRMDGIEVLEVFRERRPDVRRVLITAAPKEEAVTRAVRDGLVHMVVAKPPSIADIRLAVAWL